ncbi:MAG: ribonuclease III, partial [Deltaproteobacteria bacterium]
MSGRTKIMRQLCGRLGYEFSNLDLLDEALTHK